MSWLTWLFGKQEEVIEKPKKKRMVSTKADRVSMYKAYQSGVTRKEISERYNISYSAVCRIIRRSK